MRAERRAAGANFPLEVARRGVAVERGIGPGAQTAAARVVPTRVESEDVLVEAHEQRRGRGEYVRLAEARAERVVRGLALEEAHDRALAQLRQMAAQLHPFRYGRRPSGGLGQQT